MTASEYPGALLMLVNEQRVSIDQNSHVAIVIHKTGGPGNAQDQAEYFATNTEEHSVHYVIGQDGTIVQCVLEKDGAGGNCCTEPGHDTFWDSLVQKYGDLNLCTLSIEHCDPRDDNSTPVTAAQKAASFGLVKSLIGKYHIPVGNVKTHKSIDPESRANCPGNYPMDELLSYLEQSEEVKPMPTLHVPDGWSLSGDKLVAPNGKVVVLGFKDHILADPNWDAANVPLMNETHYDVLYQSESGDGGGQLQVFLYSALAYNTKLGVVQYKTGQELLYYLNVVKELGQRVNDLNVPTAFVTMLQQLLVLGAQTLQTLEGKPQASVAQENATLG